MTDRQSVLLEVMMPRVAKHPDVRREELMDTALELIITVGYDTLSIEQITQTAGVAKGTFYYYFTSKQDLLVQIVARLVNEIFDHLTATLPRLTGSAVERFQQLLTEAASFEMSRSESAAASVPLLYKPENREVRNRLFEEWHERCRPLFYPIIEQGHRDGTFDVADSEATTEIVLSLWMDASTRILERALATATEDEFADEVVRGQQALMQAVERILGAPDGSFALPVGAEQYRAYREPFLAALNAPEPTPTDPRSAR